MEYIPDYAFARHKINLATGETSKTVFINKINSVFVDMFDYPIINEQYRGREYCYVYGTSMVDYSRTAIIKKNLCNPTADKFWYKENHYLSEVWFFPTPEGKAEDDGVIMTIAFDGEKKQSYLLLLDGFSLETVAITYLPYNVPWTAHGMHFPEAQYDF